MLFTLRELLRWLGVSVFELLTLSVCLLVFSVLLTLKVESGVLENLNWFWIFAPLFVADAINAYFSVIVFIRMQVDVSGTFLSLSLTFGLSEASIGALTETRV